MNKVVLILFLVFGFANLVGDIYSSFPFNQLYRYDSEVIDARAESLGRCSIFSSSGANYLFNNPAYLSNLSKRSIQLNGRISFGKEKHGYTDEYINLEKKFDFKLIGISYAMPLYISENKQTKISVGIGYRTYYDLSSKIDYRYDFGDGQETYKSRNKGSYSCITLGSGITVYDKVNLGLSVNVPFMSNYIEEVKSNLTHDYKVEGSFSGTFLTFSGAYELNESIKIASRIRSGFTLNWKYIDEDEPNKFLKVPWELGMSIALNTRNNTKIFLDYLTRNYSKYVFKGFYQNAKPFKNLANGFSLRTGLESGQKIILRRGIFWQSLPIYQQEKIQMELGITGGLGFKFKTNIRLDIYGSIACVNFDDSIYNYSKINEYTFTNYKFGTTLGYEF